MDTEIKLEAATNVASRVAGEDIQKGDFITVLNELLEFPSYLWCGSGAPLSADEPVRIRYLPSNAGLPYRVFAVCLPFVYARAAKGGVETFDVRQHQLARLDAESGFSIWKSVKTSNKKQK